MKIDASVWLVPWALIIYLYTHSHRPAHTRSIVPETLGKGQPHSALMQSRGRGIVRREENHTNCILLNTQTSVRIAIGWWCNSVFWTWTSRTSSAGGVWWWQNSKWIQICLDVVVVAVAVAVAVAAVCVCVPSDGHQDMVGDGRFVVEMAVNGFWFKFVNKIFAFIRFGVGVVDYWTGC